MLCFRPVLLFTVCSCSLESVQALQFVSTSSFTPNTAMTAAVANLLSFVRPWGVDTTSLSSAVSSNGFHRDVTDTNNIDFGLTAGTGDTLTPTPRITHLRRFLFVDVNDGLTHIILSGADVDILLSRNYGTLRRSGGAVLNPAASTALHELTHAMIFRTRCFTGSLADEEKLVQALESAIIARVSADERGLAYDLARARGDRGDACIDLLGLATSRVTIDFEKYPGPDGRLGTSDDLAVPIPDASTTFCGAYFYCEFLTTQYASVGITFSKTTLVYNGYCSTDTFFCNNHYTTMGGVYGSFSGPVYGITLMALSYSFGQTLTAFDSQGNVVAADYVRSDPNGPVTLHVTSSIPIARFALENGPEPFCNADNLWFQTSQ